MDKKIIKKICRDVKSECKKIGKDTKWLKFARKTKYGWGFLKNKEKQFETLELIANNISRKYYQYSSGQIAEELSMLVNKQ